MNSTNTNSIFGFSSIEYLLGGLLALFITGMLLIPNIYSDAAFTSYISYEKDHPSAVRATYANIQDNINQSKFAADSSLFIFWAVIGLIVYTFGEFVIKFVKEVIRFRDVIRTSPYNSSPMIRETLTRVAARFAAVAGTYLLATMAIRYVIPLLLYILSLSTFSLWLIPQAILVAAIVFIYIHGFVVLVRVMFLKIRLFQAN